MSPAKALARIIEMNLTERNYQKLRNDSLEYGADIYPPYDKIMAMKNLCKPSHIIYKDDEVVATVKDTVDQQLTGILGLNPEIGEMDAFKK